MARPLKQILVNYDKAFYVRKGIRHGEACYKVICCRNYCTVREGFVTALNIEINKEKTVGVYSDLQEAEECMKKEARKYIDSIVKGEK